MGKETTMELNRKIKISGCKKEAQKTTRIGNGLPSLFSEHETESKIAVFIRLWI